MEKEQIITVENKNNKGNPNHKPAGSPEGGQFTSSSASIASSFLDFLNKKKDMPGFGITPQKEAEPIPMPTVTPSKYSFDDIVKYNFRADCTLNSQHMRNCFDTGTDKAKQIVSDFFMSTKTRIDNAKEIAHYAPLWHTVCYQPKDLKSVGKYGGCYELGETFFHEIFHGIDDRYGSLSTQYKLSNGKTLKEVFHDEIYDNKYSWSMKLFNEVKQEFENAVQEEMGKMFTPEQIKEYKDKSKFYMDKMNSLTEDWRTHNKLWQYPNTTAYDQAYDEYAKAWKEAKKEWAAANDAFLPARQKAIHKYSCLSDFCSFIYRTGTGSKSICGGHPKAYWSQDNGTKPIKEMFAELGSMWSRGKKDDLDRMRKYFPNTVASFEELVGKLDDIRKEKYIV